MSIDRGEILCIGEVLWDALPTGLFLGGAPFNVACNLHALGEDVAMVSRVGDDRLGREALRRLRTRGMRTDLVQVDAELDTGFVHVTLGGGEAEYVIVQPAAWDALALTRPLTERASQAAALVFGSLAQRQETARRTVRRLCKAGGESGALTVYDVNLRPPYTERNVVESSLDLANVVKLNEEELQEISTWFDLPIGLQESVKALAHRFDCQAVCVTCGAKGSVLWRRDEWTEQESHSVTVKDSVGAGDAFLAALLAGLLAEQDSELVIERASRLGAFVASRSGATPEYVIGGLDDVHQLPLSPPDQPEVTR